MVITLQKTDKNYKSIKWEWVKNYKAGKVQALKFKTIIYKTKDLKGRSWVGQAKVDFLESKYKEKHKVKKYNFDKFLGTVLPDEDKIDRRNFIRNPEFKSSTGNPNDIDPILHNPANNNHKFDDEDAILHLKPVNNNQNNNSNSQE